MTITPPTNERRVSPRSPFFDTGEAAHYLRLELRTLVNWRSRGGGPRYRKHGGRVLYHIDDLESWSRGRTRGPDE